MRKGFFTLFRGFEGKNRLKNMGRGLKRNGAKKAFSRIGREKAPFLNPNTGHEDYSPVSGSI